MDIPYKKRITMSAKNYKKDDEYYTPKYLVKHFGSFDYDPATNEEKAKEFNIINYDTIETDGLKNDWTKYSKIWINPPFTMKKNFIEKAVETYKICKNCIYILLPVEFLTTKRFHNIMSDIGFKIYIPSGRIKFESGKGKQSKSPAFGSIIIKLQDKYEIELLKLDDIESR